MMEKLPISTNDCEDICTPSVLNQNDLELYQKLSISISEIWENGQNLSSNKRKILWQQFLMSINQFIYVDSRELLNFERCLAVGALIFKLESDRIYIYSNFSYIKQLFRYLEKPPSDSAIYKQLGQLSAINPKKIDIINQFNKFLNNLEKNKPNSFSNYGWSLFIIKHKFGDINILKSYNIENMNIKILDSIIDDNFTDFI